MLKCTNCKRTLDLEFKKMTWHQLHSLMRGDSAVLLCPHCEKMIRFRIKIEVCSAKRFEKFIEETIPDSKDRKHLQELLGSKLLSGSASSGHPVAAIDQPGKDLGSLSPQLGQ